MATVFFQNEEKARVVSLVISAQRGDREAFGRLFECYEGHVFAIAIKRLGDFCEAQELCQDVFVQAMQKIDQLRKPECFGGWLRSIAKRMAINRAVRRSPDVAAEPAALAAVCVDKRNPLRDVLASERQAQVRAGLDRLGDLDRATLVAFYVEGRSLLEMSDEFDCAAGHHQAAPARCAKAIGQGSRADYGRLNLDLPVNPVLPDPRRSGRGGRGFLRFLALAPRGKPGGHSWLTFVAPVVLTGCQANGTRARRRRYVERRKRIATAPSFPQVPAQLLAGIRGCRSREQEADRGAQPACDQQQSAAGYDGPMNESAGEDEEV